VAGAGGRYDVRIEDRGGGWRVAILDRSSGEVVATRACASRAEAELYASTVRQHAGWLSEDRFRAYYGVEG
jgi:hypothetical protein